MRNNEEQLKNLLICWRCDGTGVDHGQTCHVCGGVGGPNYGALHGKTVQEALDDIYSQNNKKK